MRIVSFDSTPLNNSSASGNFKVNLFLKDLKTTIDLFQQSLQVLKNL